MKKESLKNPMKTFLDTYIKLKKIFFKWGQIGESKKYYNEGLFECLFYYTHRTHTHAHAL
jgi:hypothetical protein